MQSQTVPAGHSQRKQGRGASAAGGEDVTQASLVAKLREMILSGDFPPGSAVPQVPLAKKLGVSTTPLREAMRQLQSEGLLEVERNRRARIPPLDINDMNAVYAGRVLLEAHAVFLTTLAGNAELHAALRNDLKLMSAAQAANDVEAWIDSHTAFHVRLVSGAPPQLMPTIRNFFARGERYRRLAFVSSRPRVWSNPQDEHESIVDACTSGDAPAAARTLGTHLAKTAIQLSAAFAPEVDPAPVRVAISIIAGSANGQANGQPAGVVPFFHAS